MRRAMFVAALALCLATAVVVGFTPVGAPSERLRAPIAGLGIAARGPGPGGSAVPAVVFRVPCHAGAAPAGSRTLFRVGGRCTLATNGPAQCLSSGGDDYGAVYSTTTAHGDPAYVTVAVEGYTGTGRYSTADVLFEVLYGTELVQWEAPRATVTITTAAVALPATVLSPVPGTGSVSALEARGTLPCAPPASRASGR